MLCFPMWLLLDFILQHKHFVKTIDVKAIPAGQKKHYRSLSKNHLAILTGSDWLTKNDSSGRNLRTIPTTFGRKEPGIVKEVARDRRNADFILQWKLDRNTTATLYAYKYNVRQNCCFNSTKPYDSKGAMYFAIAVILFYGISIAMLVAASTLKRSRTDYELKGFLRSYARIEEEKRTREKQLVRTVLQQRNLLHLWPGSSHRPSFISRVAQLESLRRASRTSACSNATSKKSSIDRTSLLEAISEERRRASFPEKRVTPTDQVETIYSKQGGLFKTRSCAEVVVAGLEKMMEADVIENGRLKQGATTFSAPVSSTISTIREASFPKQRNKLNSLRGRSERNQQQDNQSNSAQKTKHKKCQQSLILPNLPVVTVELFEDTKEVAEDRKGEVHDDLVIHGTIKRAHRRSSEICLKNVMGS